MTACRVPFPKGALRPPSRALDRAGFSIVATGLKQCLAAGGDEGDLDTAKMEKLFKFPDSFTKSVSSGTTMAPSSDKRPEVKLISSGEEFTFETNVDDFAWTNQVRF